MLGSVVPSYILFLYLNLISLFCILKIIWTHIPYIINSSICLRVKYTVFAQNISNWDWAQAGLSIFIKCTSTSLFTDGTFYENLNISHEYLIQHSLKLGGTNYQLPGTATY